MKKYFVFVFAAMLFSSVVSAKVVGRVIEYKAGDTTLKGYLAYDDASSKKRPGVLVVHEWWGHNAYARKRAQMLAQLGYVALAVDMYGDGKTAQHPKDAGSFSSAVAQNLPVAKKRFTAALELLNKHALSDAQKTAAIGYCFGGHIVLQMAREGVDLDAVVSFHGSLGTGNPAQGGKVRAKILVFNGVADPFVKPASIDAFKKEMTDAGVDFEFVNLPNAKHSFTNPEADKYGKKFNLPLAYNKNADEVSWKGMQKLFNKVFE